MLGGNTESYICPKCQVTIDKLPIIQLEVDTSVEVDNLHAKY